MQYIKMNTIKTRSVQKKNKIKPMHQLQTRQFDTHSNAK